MRTKLCSLIVSLLVLGGSASGGAQGIGETDLSSGGKKLDNNSGIGGTATSGTGVKTGKGPLSQPIPPAASTLNPQQNPQRPLNTRGPTLTNPPQQPFGSK